MSWQVLIVLHIIAGSIVAKILIKKFSSLSSRLQWLNIQYFLCLLFSIGLLIYQDKSIFYPILPIIIALGVFGSLGTYAQWRSINLSLSMTALFTPASGLIALILGYLLLKETQYLNPSLVAGIILSFGAVVIFTHYKIKNAKPAKKAFNKEFNKYISIVSIIGGLVIFAMRFFALEGVSIAQYVFGWYLGTFIGSLVLLYFSKKKSEWTPINRKLIVIVFFLAGSIWISKILVYGALQLAPVTVVEPIFQVSEIIIPALLGIFLYKEIIKLGIFEKITFAIGVIGSIIIAISF